MEFYQWYIFIHNTLIPLTFNYNNNLVIEYLFTKFSWGNALVYIILPSFTFAMILDTVKLPHDKVSIKNHLFGKTLDYHSLLI